MKLAWMLRGTIDFWVLVNFHPYHCLCSTQPGPVWEINNLFPKRNPISNPWNTPSRKPAAFSSLYYVETAVHVGVETNSHNLAMMLWWDTEKSVWHAESNWVSRVWCSLSISLLPLDLAANHKLNVFHNMKQDHRCIWKQYVFNSQEICSYQSCSKAMFASISTCHKGRWLMCEEMQKPRSNYNLRTCLVMTLAFYVALFDLISVAWSQHIPGITGLHIHIKKICRNPC